MKNTPFKIYTGEASVFKKSHIIKASDGTNCKVLKVYTGKNTWWKKLLTKWFRIQWFIGYKVIRL